MKRNMSTYSLSYVNKRDNLRNIKPTGSGRHEPNQTILWVARVAPCNIIFLFVVLY